MFAHKHDAYRVYLTFSALWSLARVMLFTVFTFYLVIEMEFTPLQLVLTGTVMELAAFLTEVPTGVVADLYSRRLSVIIGTVMMGISCFVFIIPSFVVVLLSQAILAFGWTFISGADSAWITDEIGESAAGRAFLRRSQVAQVVSIVGIILSVGLAMVNLRLPFVVGGMVFIANGLYLLAFMPETGFTPAPREEITTFGSMLDTTREGARTIRGRPVLITLMLAIFVAGAFSEGYDRLWAFHILENFNLPRLGQFDIVIWFGVIGIVGAFIGMTATEFVRHRVNTDDQIAIARALIRVNVVLVASLMIFAITGQFALALICVWVIGTTRAIIEPLRTAWINQGLNPGVRATVISMSSQMDAIGQIAGGPGIGVIGNQFGVRVALGLGGIILAPVLGLYARTIRQNGRIAGNGGVQAAIETDAPV